MDTSLILDYILIFFFIVIGILLSGVLYRAYIILGKVEKIMDYADHVRRLMSSWEQVPFAILNRITSYFTK